MFVKVFVLYNPSNHEKITNNVYELQIIGIYILYFCVVTKYSYLIQKNKLNLYTLRITCSAEVLFIMIHNFVCLVVVQLNRHIIYFWIVLSSALYGFLIVNGSITLLWICFMFQTISFSLVN